MTEDAQRQRLLDELQAEKFNPLNVLKYTHKPISEMTKMERWLAYWAIGSTSPVRCRCIIPYVLSAISSCMN